MEIVEYGLLDLQKEPPDITGFITRNLDIIITFFVISVFLGLGYNSFLPMMPFIILLVVYVIASDNEDQAKEKNNILINHALKQNNWFESVRENAYKWFDKGVVVREDGRLIPVK